MNVMGFTFAGDIKGNAIIFIRVAVTHPHWLTT